MIKSVVFDLGGVLIDWNPRYLYRKILANEAEIEAFLSDICTPAWNHQMDLGKPFEEAARELIALHPDKEDLILAYWRRWPEMLEGPIHESVDLLMELKERGTPLYALSNWNADTFEVAQKDFPFLRLFDGKIISGQVKLAKPDPRIYRLLLDTYDINPRETLFIDDVRANVQAAWDIGMNAVQFLSPKQLENDLAGYGLIPSEDIMDEHHHHCGSDCHEDHRHDMLDSEEPAGCCGGGCSCR
jgi:2-haloacid dehalogenase